MKVKLNVWVSPGLETSTSLSIKNFLRTHEESFEEVAHPHLAHVMIIDCMNQLASLRVSPGILCLSIGGTIQPKDSSVISIQRSEVGMNLKSALIAIRRHEEMLGIPLL